MNIFVKYIFLLFFRKLVNYFFSVNALFFFKLRIKLKIANLIFIESDFFSIILLLSIWNEIININIISTFKLFKYIVFYQIWILLILFNYYPI